MYCNDRRTYFEDSEWKRNVRYQTFWLYKDNVWGGRTEYASELSSSNMLAGLGMIEPSGETNVIELCLNVHSSYAAVLFVLYCSSPLFLLCFYVPVYSNKQSWPCPSRFCLPPARQLSQHHQRGWSLDQHYVQFQAQWLAINSSQERQLANKNKTSINNYLTT
jgi:hypothetical protein